MKWALLFLPFAVASAALAAATPLNPRAIAADIAAHGADAVVTRLFTHGDYDRVLDHIDKGEAEWVALAPKLAPGTDAGTAESLVIALAFALPKNPRAVLPLITGKDAFPVEDVCGAPFIEGTIGDIPAYVKKAKAAVSRVSDPKLAKAKAACLAQLDKA
jgi:hypothetical protein